MTLNTYVDDETLKRLIFISEETGQSITQLIDAAVAKAAINYFRNRTDDPAKEQP